MAVGEAHERVEAWRPALAGVREVFHARFVDHAYPPHTHDAWTVLTVHDGAVRYRLDRHDHGSHRSVVTLLPPHVVHDGRAATGAGFRKQVLYLGPELLGDHRIGPAVDHPTLTDPALATALATLHDVLRRALALTGVDGRAPGPAVPEAEALEAEARLAFVVERLAWHLDGRLDAPAVPPWPPSSPWPGPGDAGRPQGAVDDGRPSDGVGHTTAHLAALSGGGASSDASGGGAGRDRYAAGDGVSSGASGGGAGRRRDVAGDGRSSDGPGRGAGRDRYVVGDGGWSDGPGRGAGRDRYVAGDGGSSGGPSRGRGLAGGLRDLLDAAPAAPVTLADAAARLGASPTHLVRAFGAAFGMPPHAYLVARRVDEARRRLLDGEPPAAVALATGFHDQAHLTRHFRRHVGTTPGRYAAGAGLRRGSGRGAPGR